MRDVSHRPWKDMPPVKNARVKGHHEKHAQKVGDVCGIKAHFARFKTFGEGGNSGENKSNVRRSKFACIVKVQESTRKRFGKTTKTIMKIALLGRGQFVESQQTCAQGHSHAPSNANPRCDSRSGQRVGKIEKLPSNDESKEQKRGHQ